MANTKSVKKRIKQNEKRRIKNSAVKSSIRTASKKVLQAVDKGTEDKSVIEDLYKSFVKKIDTASGKKILHWKTVARKKSRLAKKVNSYSSGNSAEA